MGESNSDMENDPSQSLSLECLHGDNVVSLGWPLCKINEENSRNTLDKTLEPKIVPLRSMLSSSVSAQDLRCLDIKRERQDESSPRGVLEACKRGLGSEPEVDPPETDDPDTRIHCLDSKHLSHWGRFITLWKKRSMKRMPSFPPLAVPKMSSRKSKSAREDIPPMPTSITDTYNYKHTWNNFSLSDLQTATNNFSPENLIGRGGYAQVYKGCLKDGQFIAVKHLTRGTVEEQTVDFLSELGVTAHVNHPNTAKLIGFGVEGGMYIVFQLSPLGSLGSLLHGSKEKLDWSIRYKVALGTADGLLYLHENCQRRIIHRDIKADNILLTEDFEPQICDFGLAKWLPEQLTHHNVSKFEGTFGYFAPEYFMHGIVDEKTDIYAFGVLLLELITGRRALDHLQQSLVIWAKPLLDKDDYTELIDPSLGDAYNPEEMDRVVLTAALCIEQSPILRPRMRQAVVLLRGDEYCAELSSKESQKQSIQRTYSEETFDAEEYNSTRYLKDLNRHKQLALGNNALNSPKQL